MATQDDDTLTGSVPDPEAEASAVELAHARRFADLVDKTLTGRTPPAMSADDRALLEVATVIRATHGKLALEPARQAAVVEDALRQAIGDGPSGRAPVVAVEPRARRWTPWLVAAGSMVVAAAAIALLWLRPAPVGAPVAHHAAPAPAVVPEEQRSRSADPLIGPIAHEHAGDAGARIDAIFADRLDGFRTRRLTRGGAR